MKFIKMLSSILVVCLLLAGCGTKNDTPLMEQDNDAKLSGGTNTDVEGGHSDKEENVENGEGKNKGSEQSLKEAEENEGNDKSEQELKETGQNEEVNQDKGKKEVQGNTEHRKNAEQTEENLVLEGFTICVDAGHGIADYGKMEAIAPNSEETKPAFASGTRGKNQTEEQLNLIVAKKLEKKLKELGADVYMTRTGSATDMSNIDRAKFANSLNADLTIRIHADGSSNKNTRGISMLVPASDYINDTALLEKSERAGKLILEEVVAQTGAVNRGIIKRSDLTGFNWSKVPVVLIEMGFMTNPEEDSLLETDEYQNKIVQGIINGMIKYFSN